MKDKRFPKILLFSQPSRAKQKASHPRLVWGYTVKKDLREMGASWEGVKREALNRWGCKGRVRRCLGLGWLSALVSC